MKYNERLREKLDAQGRFLESDNAEGANVRDSLSRHEMEHTGHEGVSRERTESF